jgi:tetratricopeptide (TPR) repeat protein
MSGAALLSDGLVVGVITEDTPNFSGGRLTAVPVANMIKDNGFVAAWHAVTGKDPFLDPVELVPLTVQKPRERPAGSPASLLRADSEIVRFRGRTQEVQQLRAWADGSGLGAHLLVGAAGQGKSRLARELARRLGHQGWITAWLREHVDDAHYERIVECREKLLLIIDYAETRPRQLKRLLLEVQRHSGEALRILMIARSNGEWWDRLQEELAYDAPVVLGDAAITKLAPLEDSATGRETTFREAIDDLSEALADATIDPDKVLVPEDLNGRQYDSVLAIHLAALITLLQASSTALPLPPGLPPEVVLLAHERRYWRKAALTFGIDLDAEIRDVTVTMAALCGAQNRDEGLALLSAVPGLADQPHDQRLRALKWLRGLYPPETKHGWGPLEPDRIAEYLIAGVLREQPELISTVMPATSAHQTRRAITILARAACHQPDSAVHIANLLTASPDRAPIAVEVAPQSENPDPIVDALMKMVKHSDCSVDALIKLGEAIPDRTQVMAKLAVEVWVTIAMEYDRPAVATSREHYPDHATALNNLSNCLGELGCHDEAVDMAAVALKVFKEYSPIGPDDHPELYASILHNLAAHLSDVGRHSEALPIHQASTDAYRDLADTSPESYLPDLAMSLHSLSMCLSRQNSGREALQVGRQAVDLYRGLAETSLGRYGPELANSLNSLSARLSDEGLFEEALSASQEAVVTHRLLADQNPDSHLPRLAGALNTYATHLARSGALKDAVTATDEAMKIYRELSVRNPGQFAARLAGAMNNLSVYLARAGRRQEALSALEEAVSVYDEIPGDLSPDNLSGLAGMLDNLSNRFAENGRPGEALSASYRSVAVLISLAEGDPDAHLASLARGRVNLAARCGTLRRFEEGINAAEAAVADLRALTVHHSERGEPDLASALIVLGYLLVQSGVIPSGSGAVSSPVLLHDARTTAFSHVPE